MVTSHSTHKGFTLIEMMIVVAIIGILASITASKFGQMMQATREGNIRNSLGIVRSALMIYFSDNIAYFPTGAAQSDSSLLEDALVPKYLDEIPKIQVYPYHALNVSTVDTTNTSDFATHDPTDDGEWVYVSNYNDNDWGIVAVECYHTDTKGNIWSSQ